MSLVDDVDQRIVEPLKAALDDPQDVCLPK